MTSLPEYLYQTNTKYMTSRQAGCPSIINQYGSLNDFLKVVLTTGFNEQIVSSVTIKAEEPLVRFNVPLNHGYTLNQVLVLEGAEQDAYNKEYRVVNFDSEYVEVLKPSGSITGVSTLTSLKLKVAPLGYTIPYENKEEGVVCFKNKSTKSPAIIRIIDKLPPNEYDILWAKYARVTIGQSLDSYGKFTKNIKAPYHPEYPQAEETGNGVKGSGGVHGFAKWEYAIYGSSYNTMEVYSPNGTFPTDWRIIGDDKTFYLMIRSMGKNNYHYNLIGYGTYASDNPSETNNICLQAKDGFISADSSLEYAFSRSRAFFGALNYGCSGFILTDIYNSSTSNYNRHYNISNLIADEYRNRPWHSPRIKSLNPVSGKWVTGFLYIKDYDGYIRGFHRGIQISYGTSRMPDELVDSHGSLYLEVQDPIHTSSAYTAPVIFTLKNWEYVL